MYFTTTKFHQENAGGIFEDIIVDDAYISESFFKWKGNVDLEKLKKIVDKNGADKIAYVSLECNVNMAGGQPISMQNLIELHNYCKELNIKIFLDATRAVENAYFIQQLDPL